MIYTFVSQHFPQQFVRDMQEFVTLLGTAEYERCSLVAFFEPDPVITTHGAFVDCFWELLQRLHKHDSHPALERTPDDPLWEFSFKGCEMFVVGSSPTYKQRRSRNLGPGIVLIFSPEGSLLILLPCSPSQPKCATGYTGGCWHMTDGMSVHPDIGFYGQPNNREWKQYALPDDNSPETGSCPFHTRMH